MKIGNVIGETGKATVVAMLGSLTLIADLENRVAPTAIKLRN